MILLTMYDGLGKYIDTLEYKNYIKNVKKYCEIKNVKYICKHKIVDEEIIDFEIIKYSKYNRWFKL